MSAVDSFVREAQRCAVMFRLGRDVEAGLAMIELAAALQALFDDVPANIQQQWLVLLGYLQQCQEPQNWHWLTIWNMNCLSYWLTSCPFKQFLFCRCQCVLARKSLPFHDAIFFAVAVLANP